MEAQQWLPAPVKFWLDALILIFVCEQIGGTSAVRKQGTCHGLRWPQTWHLVSLAGLGGAPRIHVTGHMFRCPAGVPMPGPVPDVRSAKGITRQM